MNVIDCGNPHQIPSFLTSLRLEQVECFMSAAIVVFSLILIVVVLHDAFETMLLPRRISRQFRFARFFFQIPWRLWSPLATVHSFEQAAECVPQPVRSALVPDPAHALWALGLICGFALLHWALGTTLALRPTRHPACPSIST